MHPKLLLLCEADIDDCAGYLEARMLRVHGRIRERRRCQSVDIGMYDIAAEKVEVEIVLQHISDQTCVVRTGWSCT